MPVCSVVKLLPRGVVDDLMHYCTRTKAEYNSSSGRPTHPRGNNFVITVYYLIYQVDSTIKAHLCLISFLKLERKIIKINNLIN